MKPSIHFIRVGAMFGAMLLPASGQGPVLGTPGSASWESFETATGTRTVFTIRDDSVFHWSGFNLPRGDELVFSFDGGDSVVNHLQGSGLHFLDGTVSGAGGSVGFFSPDGDLIVNGSITAGSVTLATTEVDAAGFAAGGAFSMAGKGGFNILTVNGSVTATDGDVVLAGRHIDVGASALIEASDAVRYGAGDQVSVSGSGDEQLEVSGKGYILHLGTTHASRIEMKAGRSITNRGELGIQNGRIFVEVGPGGSLRNEAVIIDELVYEGTVIGPAEANGTNKDALGALNDGTLKIPALKRKDGSKVSGSRVVRSSVPMSASADGTRDNRRSQEKVAKRGASKSILTGQSLFGSRAFDGKAR